MMILSPRSRRRAQVGSVASDSGGTCSRTTGKNEEGGGGGGIVTCKLSGDKVFSSSVGLNDDGEERSTVSDNINSQSKLIALLSSIPVLDAIPPSTTDDDDDAN